MRMTIRASAVGGVATGLLLLAGPSADAAGSGPLTLEGWDLSTCETDGAARPMLHYALSNPGPYSIVAAFGIDDGDFYDTTRIGPGDTGSRFTGRPISAGEHVIYELNRDPAGPRGSEL